MLPVTGTMFVSAELGRTLSVSLVVGLVFGERVS